MRRAVAQILALYLVLLFTSACGYHLAGHASLLPANIKTIAVPAFQNVSSRYRLTGRLPGAIGREFISRTRYQVVSDPAQADAVLSGAVLSYNSYPTLFDPASGRASGIEMILTMRITLTERASGKVLFTRNSMEVRERYEISVDQRAYFEESDIALERMSRNVARAVVSAILENF